MTMTNLRQYYRRFRFLQNMKNSFWRHTVISSRDDDTSSKAGYKKKKEKEGGVLD
jgi:hypothetical protein